MTELDLSNNQIKYIGKFSDMKALYVLRLSYNQIKTLNDHSFDCLEFLKELHLNRNKLTYISENIGKLKNLKILNFRISWIAKFHRITTVAPWLKSKIF